MGSNFWFCSSSLSSNASISFNSLNPTQTLQQSDRTHHNSCPFLWRRSACQCSATRALANNAAKTAKRDLHASRQLAMFLCVLFLAQHQQKNNSRQTLVLLSSNSMLCHPCARFLLNSDTSPQKVVCTWHTSRFKEQSFVHSHVQIDEKFLDHSLHTSQSMCLLALALGDFSATSSPSTSAPLLFWMNNLFHQMSCSRSSSLHGWRRHVSRVSRQLGQQTTKPPAPMCFLFSQSCLRCTTARFHRFALLPCKRGLHCMT